MLIRNNNGLGSKVKGQYITSFMPFFGKKHRLAKSNPDSVGAAPVAIMPSPGHLRMSSICGCNSMTDFADGSTTCKIQGTLTFHAYSKQQISWPKHKLTATPR